MTVRFVVLSPSRSGASLVQGLVDTSPGGVCAYGLFGPGSALSTAAHQRYLQATAQLPPFVNGHPVPDAPADVYLRLFFRLAGDRADVIGLRIPYNVVSDLDLFDLLAEFTRGGMIVVRVRRNPVACYVSQCQALGSGRWTRLPGERPSPPPLPASIDADALIDFCRQAEAARGKAEALPGRSVDLDYTRDLVYAWPRTAARLRSLLRLPQDGRAPEVYLRQTNRPFSERVGSVETVRAALPGDVRDLWDRAVRGYA